MALCIIEFNDTELRVTRDGALIDLSPGNAVVDANRVVTGIAARPHLHPRLAHDRFWQQLNEVPLASGNRQVRHNADLAFHHLAAMLERCGRPAEVVLAAPAHYASDELALLLGICAALRVQVRGVVDASVAATAACAPPGRYTVADLFAHHSTLVDVAVDDNVTRESVRVVETCGLRRVHAACIELIADAFLEQSRFDALHQAASEQLLYDRLPGWLSEARDSEETTLSIDWLGTRFTARLATRELERITAMVVESMVEQIDSERQLLVSATLAALPGYQALLPGCRTLAPEAAAHGIAENLLEVVTVDGAVRFVTTLSAARTPTLPAVPTGHPDPPTATHLLSGATAVALADGALSLLGDGSLSAAVAAGSPFVSTRDGVPVLEPNGATVRISGRSVNGPTALRAGDAIALGDDRARFTVIHVR